MWMWGLRSGGPASSSSTRACPSSVSRAASAQPAEPAPTTMYSYVSIGVAMRASGNPAGARQQVDVRRLHLGVFLDAREPGLAPQVRLLHTAQRCLGAVVHRGVDPHAARLHLAHGAQRLRQVLRPDGGREAENAVVGDGDGVLEGV